MPDHFANDRGSLVLYRDGIEIWRADADKITALILAAAQALRETPPR